MKALELYSYSCIIQNLLLHSALSNIVNSIDIDDDVCIKISIEIKLNSTFFSTPIVFILKMCRGSYSQENPSDAVISMFKLQMVQTPYYKSSANFNSYST